MAMWGSAAQDDSCQLQQALDFGDFLGFSLKTGSTLRIVARIIAAVPSQDLGLQLVSQVGGGCGGLGGERQVLVAVVRMRMGDEA
ncbi:hypothetical protein BDBG_17797 [Blastomyces gilchristii SLH14081]|uniref:Uncharacterized protein n=1 Tax=Blastomyces gilchristii (strain SLH14081) TaxID=559298 RepID=A0A179V236_BLAGS|nr:uncharacterized protein BDBG_17797 [Blastomyces gilchristii SLH14081]OAT13401.1 hypothetical protein BDBG_17797 [Blastomyces gilchristii SLH14081]